MTECKISIIITTYNYKRYIEDCIMSCLSQQGFFDYEVLVVDDGSTDGTCDVVNKYRNNLRYYQNKNNGLEYSANFGISHARGKYIVRVDADDILHEQALVCLYDAICNTDYGFVYSDYVVIDADGRIIDEVTLPLFDAGEIRCRGDFLATGALYLKSLVHYDETVKNCGLENYRLILSLLRAGISGCKIEKRLFSYRRHNCNISSVRREQIMEYGKALAREFGLPAYLTNANHPWNLRL